jgi:hypothetical protein
MVVVCHKPVFAFAFAGLFIAAAVIDEFAGEFGAVAGFQEFGIIVVREGGFTFRTLEFERLFQVNDPGVAAMFPDGISAYRATVIIDSERPGDFRRDDRFPVFCRSHFQQFFFCGSQFHISGGKGDASQYSQTKRE